MVGRSHEHFDPHRHALRHLRPELDRPALDLDVADRVAARLGHLEARAERVLGVAALDLPEPRSVSAVGSDHARGNGLAEVEPHRVGERDLVPLPGSDVDRVGDLWVAAAQRLAEPRAAGELLLADDHPTVGIDPRDGRLRHQRRRREEVVGRLGQVREPGAAIPPVARVVAARAADAQVGELDLRRDEPAVEPPQLGGVGPVQVIEVLRHLAAEGDPRDLARRVAGDRPLAVLVLLEASVRSLPPRPGRGHRRAQPRRERVPHHHRPCRGGRGVHRGRIVELGKRAIPGVHEDSLDAGVPDGGMLVGQTGGEAEAGELGHVSPSRPCRRVASGARWR